MLPILACTFDLRDQAIDVAFDEIERFDSQSLRNHFVEDERNFVIVQSQSNDGNFQGVSVANFGTPVGTFVFGNGQNNFAMSDARKVLPKNFMGTQTLIGVAMRNVSVQPAFLERLRNQRIEVAVPNLSESRRQVKVKTAAFHPGQYKVKEGP